MAFTLRKQQRKKLKVKTWGVKYHELYMGKPRCDILIGDRAIFFNADCRAMREAIESFDKPVLREPLGRIPSHHTPS